jgi:DNA-binding CsgD family transcriptional regulator
MAMNAQPPINSSGQNRTALGSDLLSECAWDEIACSLKLSDRELEIVGGVFNNRIESTMAADLAISTHTVHTHLNRLFKKLEVTTRAELILRIINELLLLTISPGGSLPPICRYRAGGNCPLDRSPARKRQRSRRE